MKRGFIISLMALFLIGCGANNLDSAKDGPISQDDFNHIVEERSNGNLPDGYDSEHINKLTPPTESDFEPDYTYYNKLTVDEGIGIIKEGKSAIIYFGWTECIYCYRFRQTYDFVLADLGTEISYIEVADVQAASKEKQDELFGLYNVVGTPTVVVIKDGVETARMSDDLMGTLNYTDLLEWTYNQAKEVGIVE